MIVFDILMTFIESIFIAIFNKNIFKVKKISYVIILSTMIFFETMFFNNFVTNNLALLFLIILTSFLITVFYTKKFYSYYYLVPSIGMAILLLANTIALFITASIFRVNVINIADYLETVITLSISSRLIFGIILLLFYKYQGIVDTNQILMQQNWVPFLIFSISLLSTFTTLYESIFYQMIDHDTLELLLFELFTLVISLFIVLYNVINNYRLNRKIKDELLKAKYSKEIYNEINKLSYQIIKDKHDMSYILTTVYNYLKQNDINNALLQLDKSIDHLRKSDISYTTNIPIFDYYIVNTINFFRRGGYDIKTVITINYPSIIEKWEIIEIIKNLLNYVIEYTKSSKKFSVHINTKNHYLIVKFVIPKNDNEFNYSNYKDEFVKSYNQSYQDENIIIKLLF